MYNKRHICTYQYYDSNFYPHITEKFDMEDVKGFEIFADDIYRADIKIAFDGLKIDDVINLIPFTLKDEDTVILFSYDFFFLTHKCIFDNFSDESFQRLKFVLESKNFIIEKIKNE